MPSSRRFARKVAAYVLLAWVLALGAGVANACGLMARVAAAPHVGTVMSIAEAQQHVAAKVHHHTEKPDAGKSGCVKFCDDVKASTVAIETSIDVPAPALLTTAPVLRLVDDGAASTRRLAGLPDGHQRPARPLNTTFLKLTL